MTTDESHDELLPETARARADADAADTGWISPVYHGNEAETDLKLVGEISGMAILIGMFLPSANLHSTECCICKYETVKSLE
jgi:hypothetical protein